MLKRSQRETGKYFNKACESAVVVGEKRANLVQTNHGRESQTMAFGSSKHKEQKKLITNLDRSY